MNIWKRKYYLVATALLVVGCGEAPVDSAPGGDTEVLTDSLGRELGPISAEIVRANRGAEADMTLVARLEVQPNELIEFYEPQPGLIMTMGAGAPSAPVIGERMQAEHPNAAALWAALTKNAPMPNRLSDAVERSKTRLPALRPEGPIKPVETISEMPAEDPLYRPEHAGAVDPVAHLTSAWCDSTYYTHVDPAYASVPLGACPSWSYNVCKDHRTGNAGASHSDAYIFMGNVCPYRGNVTYKITADESWISQGSFTVLQNTYRGKTFSDGGCRSLFNDCPSIRTEILNAENDGYQWRFHVLE
jgi:hypothetical protein